MSNIRWLNGNIVGPHEYLARRSHTSQLATPPVWKSMMFMSLPEKSAQA